MQSHIDLPFSRVSIFMTSSANNTLIVITGATASGKTSLAIDVARHLGCDIISADSRQIYRDLPIGTAAPTAAEQAAVKHHFVGTLPVDAYYSASQYEHDVMRLLPDMWRRCPYAVMCGGSMMYIDAVTDGIDDLPAIPDSTRRHVASILETGGSEAVLAMLELLDPVYYNEVDLSNIKRVAHAVEICLAAGGPYSALRRRAVAQRPFRIIKVAIDMPRQQLFDRINSRVDTMIGLGLEDEALRMKPYRHLNALNTVGYKEMFAYFDGAMTLSEATARIAKNTRVYAKKQLTWLARPSVRPTLMLNQEDATEKLLKLL